MPHPLFGGSATRPGHRQATDSDESLRDQIATRTALGRANEHQFLNPSGASIAPSSARNATVIFPDHAAVIPCPLRSSHVASANVWRDFTVKIDVDGLEPGRSYYYQFEAKGFSAAGERSIVGRTRTLPRGRASAARLAMASCSNQPAGLFNVYALIARRTDLDAVPHLGDYLYEYANATFGDGTLLGRVPNPDKEIVSLIDYRQRHAQYKADADLQAAHRQHPFICVWDDHEITNDSWKDGAQNHNPELGEGDFQIRKRAAIRACFEWMPIREWKYQPSAPATAAEEFPRCARSTAHSAEIRD